MAGSFKVGMTLTAKDEASKVLEKGLKETTKAATEAEKAVEKVSVAQYVAAQKTARANRAAVQEARKASDARTALGIRSEQTIQREIDRSIAAYNRLARSGVASAREMERAYAGLDTRLRGLQRELYGVAKEATKAGAAARGAGGAGGGSLWQTATSVAGGVAAAGAVMAQPVLGQMSYDRKLAMMANTAFSDGGIQGRTQGKTALAASIRKAVTYGGGSKDDAAEAMNQMLASGAVSYDSANKLLPQIMKYATASGTSPLDLATLAIKGKQSFGLKDSDIPAALNMAIAAGKAGNFELKDMARWLSPQMAAAGSLGMKGIDDFGKLLSLNEAAGTTAGSSEEAGNNVVNLLTKINSQDAANAAKKVIINGHGIDLPGTLAMAREKGVNPIEAFSRVVDRVVGSDPKYQALQKRMAGAKDDTEKHAVMESMATLLEGSGVGKIVADRQALMGLLAYRNTPEYRKQVEAQASAQRTLPEGQRAGDVDFDFIGSTNDYKLEQAKNAHDFAQMDSVKKQADMLGSVADAAARLETDFPHLASVVETASTAIQAMTAAAVAFAGLKFLTGGGAGAAASGAGAAETAVGAAVKGGGIFGAMGRLLGFGGGVTALATMTTPEEDAASNGSDARWKAIREKYPQSVIDAARKRYQSWYQFGEGYSTENEQWIQQYLADPQNVNNAVPSAGQVLTPGSNPSQTGQPQSGQTLPPYLTGAAAPSGGLQITTQLVVDGQVLADVVNKHNLFDGNRSTGGPQ